MENEVNSKTVWDFPTRFFHWSVVSLFLLSWWSIEYDRVDIHHLSGYLLLALLLFRITWGFVGSTTSRFSNFIHRPSTVLNYCKRLLVKDAGDTVGHNPLGGLSVIAMIALLLAQIILGLFIEDVDGLAPGPLSHLVDYSTNRWAAETHEVLFDVLLGVIALHISAISFYLLYKKRNLISPMITGKMKLNVHTGIDIKPTWVALLIVISFAAALYWAFGESWLDLFS
ncbi:cytochrome b/b6 domain-containing protein [Aurantivibrio plasticivorans]